MRSTQPVLVIAISIFYSGFALLGQGPIGPGNPPSGTGFSCPLSEQLEFEIQKIAEFGGPVP